MQPTVTQPNIVSQLVIVATSQLKRTSFQQGAYRESLFTGWMTANKMQDYIPTVLANEAWSEPYWGPIEMTGQYFASLRLTIVTEFVYSIHRPQFHSASPLALAELCESCHANFTLPLYGLTRTLCTRARQIFQR